MATYNAYAAGLLTDHGLRIGHEPDTRVLSDASRYQLGARVVERHTAEVRFLTDHPPTAIQNLLALDGAMSEHLVTPEHVLDFDREAEAAFLLAFEEEEAGKGRKTYLEPPAKAINAIERRRELMDLVVGYRRLKRDLGLMDYSDQIELGARLAVEQPDVGVMERERFTVVLLDEYQDTSVAQATMLSRLFSGGHAVTAVGDPNQAIYGWRGASVSNILHFADTFPPAAGGRSVPAYPLTVSRRSDRRILEVGQPAGPAALRQVRRPGRHDCQAGQARRRSRRGVDAGAADPGRRAGLAGRRGRRRSRGRGEVVRHRRAHPRQRPRGRRVRRADGPRRARRDRRPVRADPAARGRRGRRHPAPAQRRHRQRRPAHPAHGSAVGDRPARPPPARPSGGRSWPAGDRGRPRLSATSSSGSPTASTPPRSPPSATRSTRPATRRTHARRSTGSACCPRSSGCCVARWASRCSTSSGGSSTPRASTSSWPRPSRPRRRPGATTSTCSSRRSPSSRRSTATSRSPPCWPTSPPRTTRATASTSRRRPRPTRSSC